MNSIIGDFCKAWKTFDANLMIVHLSQNFIYDSQWVFSSLNYQEYKSYIEEKFKNLKEKQISVEVEIVDDEIKGGKMLKLIQNGNVCFYRIIIEGDKVIKGDLCMF